MSTTIIGQAATHRSPTLSRGSALDEPVRPASPAPGAAETLRVTSLVSTRRAFGLGALSPASSRSGRASNPAHPCSPLGLGRVAMALALIASPVAAELPELGQTIVRVIEFQGM